MVGAYNDLQNEFLNQFWAVLEPLNSPRDPLAWSTPVNIGQLLYPLSAAS